MTIYVLKMNFEQNGKDKIENESIKYKGTICYINCKW